MYKRSKEVDDPPFLNKKLTVSLCIYVYIRVYRFFKITFNSGHGPQLSYTLEKNTMSYNPRAEFSNSLTL